MATSQFPSWPRLMSEYDWPSWIRNLQMDAMNTNVWQFIDPDESQPLKLPSFPVPPKIWKYSTNDRATEFSQLNSQ